MFHHMLVYFLDLHPTLVDGSIKAYFIIVQPNLVNNLDSLGIIVMSSPTGPY